MTTPIRMIRDTFSNIAVACTCQVVMYIRKSVLFFIVCFRRVFCMINELSTCHEDFLSKPPDGILTESIFHWLGFAQYLHVTTGLSHQSKAPRVMLIHKQFVIGTALDMVHQPKNYKLGHVIFGNYEQDEEECNLSLQQIKMGMTCARAYIEMPILDITPHPEFSRFGVGNSIALVKLIRPMKSNYMSPVCLPSITERMRKKKNKFVFMVDYISTVPSNFDTERMGKKTLKLLTHRDCRRQRMKTKLGSEGVTHVLCSSGCGVRNGAPILSHSADGAFELIGIAAGGGPCMKKAMRRRLNTEPPLYIDVYPYVTWIINVVTAYHIPYPYPSTFRLTETGSAIGIHKNFLRRRKTQKSMWRARTYTSGDYCFRSLKRQATTHLFYSEKFEVNADPPAKLHIYMMISAGIETKITCLRIRLPNRLVTPAVDGVGGYNVTIEFNTEWFPYSFSFSIGMHGKEASHEEQAMWFFEQNPSAWR